MLFFVVVFCCVCITGRRHRQRRAVPSRRVSHGRLRHPARTAPPPCSGPRPMKAPPTNAYDTAVNYRETDINGNFFLRIPLALAVNVPPIYELVTPRANRGRFVLRRGLPVSFLSSEIIDFGKPGEGPPARLNGTPR